MLFTVEQLELIRRLRTTGISPDQIQKAFNELEKVDDAPSNNNSLFSSSPLLVQHLTTKATPSATPQSPKAELVPSATFVFTPFRNTDQSSTTTTTTDLPPPPTLIAGTSSFEHQICSSAPRPIRSQRTPMKEITTLDNPNELEEFMKQGEEACILDMKTFITQYSLRQTTVAMMTGVSQPYISKLLNGNHRELSLRCRKNIYCWYLNCRRHPEKLASFLADPSTRLETNCDGELVPQRRERYVFRPILIRMLESFFAQTPFPDLARRVEIATACNHMLQLDKKGVGLMPKEIVSPQVVSNWFANKRKDLRRRSAEANGQNASTGSTINDSCSLASMSPPSADDESRNTTPEDIPPSCNMPFDLSMPSTTAATTTDTTTTSTSPTVSTTPNFDIFAMAQRLGITLPTLPHLSADSSSNSPVFTPTFVPPLLNFTLPPFYHNLVIKTEQ